MLFLVDTNGVPSVAHMLRVDSVVEIGVDVDFLDGAGRHDHGVDGIFLGVDPAVEDLFLRAVHAERVNRA